MVPLYCIIRFYGIAVNNRFTVRYGFTAVHGKEVNYRKKVLLFYSIVRLVSSQYLGVAEAERVNQVMEKTHLPAFHVGQKGACIESPV